MVRTNLVFCHSLDFASIEAIWQRGLPSR